MGSAVNDSRDPVATTATALKVHICVFFKYTQITTPSRLLRCRRRSATLSLRGRKVSRPHCAPACVWVSSRRHLSFFVVVVVVTTQSSLISQRLIVHRGRARLDVLASGTPSHRCTPTDCSIVGCLSVGRSARAWNPSPAKCFDLILFSELPPTTRPNSPFSGSASLPSAKAG